MSVTFLAYRRDHPTSLLVTASPAIRSPRPILIRILRALKRGSAGGVASLVSAVEFHLARSGRLLIVDETQHLTHEAVDLLRYLVDVTEARLVLSGNNTLWDRFHAKGGIPFEQLISRVTVRLHLDATRMTRKDVEVIVREALGFSARDCMDWFLERAPTRWGITASSSTTAGWPSSSPRKAVTAEHLEMAGRMME